MDDLSRVRKRIAQRRIGVEEHTERKTWNIFRMVYHFVMLVMFVCVAVLCVLLNQKLHLVKMPAVLETFSIEDISSWLPFEDWFAIKEKDQKVSSVPTYQKLAQDMYANDTNSVYNLYDGTILHIQMLENGKSNITLKQDNGVVATYAGVMDVGIKEEERILKNKILGTYDEQIKITFIKDKKSLEMNEALQN